MADRQAARQAREESRRREVLDLPTLAAGHHVRLEPPRASDQLVTAAPGPDGDIYALWSSPEGGAHLAARTTEPGGASFPDARATTPVQAVVTAHAGGNRVVATIASLELAHPMIQPLPGGRTLLVGARAAWRPDGADKNAVVINADGTQLFEATLGDGIQDVQTTTSGDVWVGYFDEGVYGNFGWGRPGPTPIGQPGIVRFDAELTLKWKFPPYSENPWGTVDDCYALNVTDDGTWSCYYSDFPVIRITRGTVTGWHNPVHGARALVVGTDDRIWLAGGYGPDRDRIVEGRLADSELRVVTEARLTLPDGSELPPGAALTGRGSDLFVLVGFDIYRVSF